ncbi:MAG TPA: hypothetical protein GX521_07620 [Firmicutes bacterium]|nr:hypothetical protein [Bacillota bacterium]
MLKNCKECNRVFAHPTRQLCEDCYLRAQQAFEAVKKFLEENPRATVAEVAEATEVDVETIYEYIKQGRLSVVPKDAGLNCQICGTQIEKGRVCAKCRSELREDPLAAAASEAEMRTSGSRMHYLGAEIKRRRR